MLRRLIPASIAAFLVAAAAAAQQTSTRLESPLDVMQRVYAPLCVEGDDLSFPMKVDAASASPLKFSTSTRELFYRWAKTACADWLLDPAAFVPSHGDVHMGNLGSYVADLASVRLAIGLKDFDESATMPFQIDLLQALISLRLTSEAAGLTLTPEQVSEAAADLLAAYRTAVDSGRTATEALAADAAISRLLTPGKASPRTPVDEWTAGGRFIPQIRSKKGEVRDLFRPLLVGTAPGASLEKSDLAEALAKAVESSPRLASVSTWRTREQFEAAIEDAATRTRPGSGGSQGMVKLVVLVRSGVRTLDGSTTDAIFYLKQQGNGSAAQRIGFINPADLPGGQRVYRNALALTLPEVDATGWCDLIVAGSLRSFFVSIRDPWENEPSEKLDTPDQVRRAANLFGTVLGAAHRNAAGTPTAARGLSTRVGATLRDQLISRSSDWISENQRLYGEWIADPRVKTLRSTAQAAWARATAADPGNDAKK
jgi:uncharacterized protein (DUF2252 family)